MLNQLKQVYVKCLILKKKVLLQIGMLMISFDHIKCTVLSNEESSKCLCLSYKFYRLREKIPSKKNVYENKISQPCMSTHIEANFYITKFYRHIKLSIND